MSEIKIKSEKAEQAIQELKNIMIASDALIPKLQSTIIKSTYSIVSIAENELSERHAKELHRLKESERAKAIKAYCNVCNPDENIPCGELNPNCPKLKDFIIELNK